MTLIHMPEYTRHGKIMKCVFCVGVGLGVGVGVGVGINVGPRSIV